MFETTVRDGISQCHRPSTQWLVTAHAGGYRTADAAYNLTVPEGFDRTDVGGYVTDRLDSAGFDAPGPALLTGVQQANARCARSGSVAVLATAGLSNPATLAVPGADGTDADAPASEDTPDSPPGTVNLVVGTTRALSAGALATLLATAVEAKTATLQRRTGFTGTTTDAVVVGCDPAGDAAEFAGSATPVGAATRRCVRDALAASLDARYVDSDPPATVDSATYGSRTDGRATLVDPNTE